MGKYPGSTNFQNPLFFRSTIMGNPTEAKALLAEEVVTKADLQQATKNVLIKVSAFVSITGVSSNITKDTLIQKIMVN